MFKFKPDPDFSRLRKTLLREKKPDRVPFYELFADPEIIDAVTGNMDLVEPKYRRQVEAIYSRSTKFFYMLGYDYVTVLVEPRIIDMSHGPFTSAEDTATLTTGQRLWLNELHGVINSRADFEKYPWPSKSDIDYGRVEKIGKNLPDGMKIIAQTSGVLELVTWLIGYETLSYGLYEHPDFMKEIFNKVGEQLLEAHSTVAQMDFVGASVMGDDMGFKSATMISPQHLREYVFPWHKKIVEAVHAQGKPFILHACGNLERIMDDLIDDVKIDAKHSFEDGIMPVTEAKKRYGERVAILGGVDMDFLCRATTDEVRTYVGNVLEQCMPGGGYCLGTGNSVANYLKLDNYLTMLQVGREWTA